MGVSLPQPKPVAASALCNARKKLDEAVFKTLNTHIITAYEKAAPTDDWFGPRVFAVDGSQINLPRPLRHADYRLPSEQSHSPQGLVSGLYELQSQIPSDFDLSPDRSERRMALGHLKILKRDDVVVYDRGYFS